MPVVEVCFRRGPPERERPLALGPVVVGVPAVKRTRQPKIAGWVAGSEVVGSEVVGSEVVGTEGVGSETTGSEVLGPRWSARLSARW